MCFTEEHLSTLELPQMERIDKLTVSESDVLDTSRVNLVTIGHKFSHHWTQI